MTNSVGIPFDSHAMATVQISEASNGFKFNKPKDKSDAVCFAPIVVTLATLLINVFRL